MHESAAAGEWLVPLKSARRIAGISSSATAEFQGLRTDALCARDSGSRGGGGQAPCHQSPRAGSLRPRASPTPCPGSWCRGPANRTRITTPSSMRQSACGTRGWTSRFDWSVAMAGPIGTSGTPSLASRRVDARSSTSGRVSEEDLWSELASADAVVFLSLHEGYGLPVVEALAVGTPVLTTSYGSQGEIAGDGGCLTADPETRSPSSVRSAAWSPSRSCGNHSPVKHARGHRSRGITTLPSCGTSSSQTWRERRDRSQTIDLNGRGLALSSADRCGGAGPGPPPAHDEASFSAGLGVLIDARDRSEVWLALSVLTGRLPGESLVLETARSSEFDPQRSSPSSTPGDHPRERCVESRGRAREDSRRCRRHVATSTLATGIQRVVREVAKRWTAIETVRFTGWTTDWQSLRDLEPSELARVERGSARTEDEGDEIAERRRRSLAHDLHSSRGVGRARRAPNGFARWRASAGRRTAALCYDLIPVTSSETSSPGMTGVFAHYMAALKYFDRLCTISQATAVEYSGWREMLPAAGVLRDPTSLPCCCLRRSATPTKHRSMRRGSDLVIGGMPLVLVVGSHEPRKNHLAILHAAEILWREGTRFSLSFIGSRSWRGDEYHDRLRQLQDQGRPVESVTHAERPLLWAATGSRASPSSLHSTKASACPWRSRWRSAHPSSPRDSEAPPRSPRTAERSSSIRVTTTT